MGFDIECILNIRSLAGEYFCPLCRTLVYPNEALQSQCTHLYCKPCLTYVANSTKACPYDGYLVTEVDSKPLTESNKALVETISKIAVKCLYHRSGCTWQGPLSESNSHCSVCAFGNSPVVCNRCGSQIVHCQVLEHAQICPAHGMNPQAQQATQGVQNAPTSAKVTAADQSQTAAQSGANTSQAQNSQSAAVPTGGQDPKQQLNANPSALPQVVVFAAVPTPEQLYQQQYQQYHAYQQYQQSYQQHYPYQQQASQQFQQNSLYLQGQQQPQAQAQPQPQALPQPQPQQHLQTRLITQPQVPSHGQPHPYVQAPLSTHQANPQQQLHAAVHTQGQIQSQTHAAPHGPVPTQAHPYLVPPHPQQHMQAPQYQQPHSQMHHPQMAQPHIQVHPQTHSHPQPQHLTQGHLQPQIQNHPQPHIQTSQPNQPTNPSAHPQSNPHSAHAPSGPNSYTQHLQIPQQQLHMTSSGSLHPAQMPGQFPQPPLQMRPPQSHALMATQQRPALLPSQGQAVSVPTAQLLQIQPQPGHQVQRPVMQPIQPIFPQQNQPQQHSFPGQQLGPVQSQLPQQVHFAQQQSMYSQLRPQVSLHHEMLSQNYVGRPGMPNPGVQSQSFSQSPGAVGATSQLRPMQLVSNQPSGHQAFGSRICNQLQASADQQIVQSELSVNRTVAEKRSDALVIVEREAVSLSRKNVEQNSNDLGRISDVVLKSETAKGENNPRLGEKLDKDADSDVRAVTGEKQTMKEEGDEGIVVSLPGSKSVVEDRNATEVVPKVECTSADLSSQAAESLEGTKNSADAAIQASQKIPPSSQVAPLADKGRHQLLMPYGPSTHQQRQAGPSMLKSGPHPAPQFNLEMMGQSPTLLRPPGPGHLAQPGQTLKPPEFSQAPLLKPPGSFHSDIPLGGPGSAATFGGGPGSFGHIQKNFEQQLHGPSGQYNQGPRSQFESAGGPPLSAVHPGSFDQQGGMVGRPPPHGPHFDSHIPGPGYVERAFRQPSGMESNTSRMDGAQGVKSLSKLGMHDSFKTQTGERLNPFSVGPTRCLDQGDFEEGFKQFPRPSHLGKEASPKFGSHFSSSLNDRSPRALEKPLRGFNNDAGFKMDSGGGGPFRFLPPYNVGGASYPNDTGERLPPFWLNDDNRGRAGSARTHPEFLGPTGFGRHHTERSTPLSPGMERHGFPLHGFGSQASGPRVDDIDGREKRSYGEGSRSFNLPSDPVGNAFHESRFPGMPSHIRRELDGPGNLRRGQHSSADVVVQDIIPGHLKRYDFFGPRNIPGHLHFGEPTGFGDLSSHTLMEELPGPGSFPHLPLGESFGGNKPSHPRLGEPGFRSSYSVSGYPNDGGFYAGDEGSFGNKRKRIPATTGCCRICEVDCETTEGLDMHSQTREHQRMTMDMVISIKQKNAKKQKNSNDHSLHQESSKSRYSGFEGRGSKP